MKRGLIILILAVAACAAAFVVTRNQCQCAAKKNAAIHDGNTMLPELEWLHHELNLDDVQFLKVKSLHLAYRPTCEALCMKVMASQKKLDRLATQGNIATPELEAALQEQAVVRVECQKAMLKHLKETAAVMSPEQARQYLDTLLPQVIGTEAEHLSEGH